MSFEPTTGAEIIARYKAARRNMEAAAQRHMRREPIDANPSLNDHPVNPQRPRLIAEGKLTMQGIAELVSGLSGISMTDIRSPSRRNQIVIPRQVICYLAHTYMGANKCRIGAFLGRDHSTVFSSIDVVDREHIRFQPLLGDAEAVIRKIIEES